MPCMCAWITWRGSGVCGWLLAVIQESYDFVRTEMVVFVLRLRCYQLISIVIFCAWELLW